MPRPKQDLSRFNMMLNPRDREMIDYLAARLDTISLADAVRVAVRRLYEIEKAKASEEIPVAS
jgi:hypothetical protein